MASVVEFSLPARSDELSLAPERPPVRRTILTGVAVVTVGLGGFGAWAATAPLSSAAVAPGVVTVEGHRKTVQHLEGGIIEALLVRDGDEVETGQVLLRLSATRPRATLDFLTGHYHALLALEARLTAERDELETIAFADELLRRWDSPAVAELMAAQEALFLTRRRVFESQTAILNRRIAQAEEEIAGLEVQVEAEERMLALLAGEIDDVRRLLAAGNALKPRLLELERRAAGIEGERGEHVALIARARQRIGEMEQQIVALRAQRLSETADELQRVQADIFGQRERLRDAEDVLARLEVRAPQPGKVVGLRFHTPGGVIGPGEPILDLVPRDDRLLVETRIRPEDIDAVRAGLTAQVRLTAYSGRSTPTLDGEVVRVSADRLIEPHSGAPYYLARVELDPASLEAVPEMKLYPGMPAEVMIITGERTAFDYLAQPLKDSFRRAFREA